MEDDGLDGFGHDDFFFLAAFICRVLRAQFTFEGIEPARPNQADFLQPVFEVVETIRVERLNARLAIRAVVIRPASPSMFRCWQRAGAPRSNSMIISPAIRSCTACSSTIRRRAGLVMAKKLCMPT